MIQSGNKVGMVVMIGRGVLQQLRDASTTQYNIKAKYDAYLIQKQRIFT